MTVCLFPKSQYKGDSLGGRERLTEVAFPAQSKNLDVETNRKLTEQKHINEVGSLPKSMGLKGCFDSLTRYLVGNSNVLPLLEKSKRKFILTSKIRSETDCFFLFLFFFFNSRLNTNTNTAKHQMFKAVNCRSSLQKFALGWWLSLLVSGHSFPYFFFKVKVQPQLKLLSESGSKCLTTEQKKVGRVTFSVALCPRFSEMITF